jgi:uncharacterized protein YsxB (DUF464 family)
MINISIFKKNNIFIGFKITGHAGYAENGYDIICAAVSILSYTVLNSIGAVAEFCSEEFEFKIDEQTGNMELNLKKTSEKSDVILKTFEIGVKLLLEDYNQYINLDYKEV